MQAFVWNERFLTGFATVDAQHQRLFDIVNRVGDMLLDSQPQEPAKIEAVFRELAAYANTHFKDEEQLMRELGLDAAYLQAHMKSHRDFVEQVKTMWAQRGAMSAPADTLHGFLVAWLTYHILGEDQSMARLVQRQKNGLTAEAARALEPARGERSTGALLDALRTLYGVLSRLNRDLADANRGLEAKVAERSRELVQSEKMASLGQLAAGVAHEINNPIGFVVSNLGSLGRYAEDLLALADIGAATPAGQAVARARNIDLDYLKTDLADLQRESQEGLERVRKIVANLKDFARVDEAEWQVADVIAGLESTLAVAAHQLNAKADIVRDLAPLPALRCMPAQLNQVFLNLLINAAQAIPTRGIITLKSRQEGDWVWIEVADNGVGMDEATRKRVFEPFFTTKPVGTGTGLGLSLTYDIVKNHQGRIEVSSQPGQGTAVRVWLPVAGLNGGTA